MRLSAAKLRALKRDLQREGQSDLIAKYLTARVVAMKPKSKRPAKLKKEAKQLTKREASRRLREAVRKRSGGLCELGDGRPMHEAHHTVSGSGLRVKHESEGTVVGLCFICHRYAHKNDLGVLNKIRDWALMLGSSISVTAMGRRIAKVEAMRKKAP